MLEKLLRLRFIYVIAVVVTLLNSLLFLFLGLRRAYHGYLEIIFTQPEANPGILLVESLDMFMIALVFLIFSLGMMRVFTHYHTKNNNLPNWLHIDSFKDLKVLLWETVLVTMVILSTSVVIKKMNEPTWDILIIPGIILMLTISLFLMRKEDH